MTKEEIIALGVTEEQAAKVLELHEKEQSDARAKLSETEAKLTAAEKNASELSEKVKAFDGVDVAALKKVAEEWETKYNADITSAKVDNAIALALTKAGAKDVDLAKHLIDTSVIKIDGDKVMGLNEQLEKVKNEKAFLFGTESSPAAKFDTGMEHGDISGGDLSDAQIREVMGLKPAAPASATGTK